MISISIFRYPLYNIHWLYDVPLQAYITTDFTLFLKVEMNAFSPQSFGIISQGVLNIWGHIVFSMFWVASLGHILKVELLSQRE